MMMPHHSSEMRLFADARRLLSRLQSDAGTDI